MLCASRLAIPAVVLVAAAKVPLSQHVACSDRLVIMCTLTWHPKPTRKGRTVLARFEIFHRDSGLLA
jgi:hypothetical protein